MVDGSAEVEEVGYWETADITSVNLRVDGDGSKDGCSTELS